MQTCILAKPDLAANYLIIKLIDEMQRYQQVELKDQWPDLHLLLMCHTPKVF